MWNGTSRPALNRPDEILLLYADGKLPVSHAKATILALGKTSDPRSDVQVDEELWKGSTLGPGTVWLANPDLQASMDLYAKEVKRQNPALNTWYYAPLPQQRPTMNVPGAPRTPFVPLVVDIDDEAVNAPTLRLDLVPGTVDTKQTRPPIGEIDGKAFMDPVAFLKQLALRYSTMDRNRSAVSLTLTRCGSPAPAFSLSSAWGQLELQLGTTRSDFQQTTAYRKKFTAVRDHVGVAVLDKIFPAWRTIRGKPIPSYYQDLLNQLAGSAKGLLSPTQLRDLEGNLAAELGTSSGEVFRGTPWEDLVLSGAVLFLVGAIVRGYLWGTLSMDDSGSNVKLSAKVNTTTSCSVDEFESYCELMKP